MNLIGYLITVNAEGYFKRVIDIKKKGNMFNSYGSASTI